LSRICRELNRLGARYVVIGGFAIIHHGFPRLTYDIDLLIETTPENEARVIEALLILPDKAARELKSRRLWSGASWRRSAGGLDEERLWRHLCRRDQGCRG